MNNVSIIGRLGSNPELAYTTSGTAVSEFSIAVPRTKTDEVDWIRIVAWGNLAETVAEHKTTGDQIAVTGELRTSEWEQDGKNRSATKVHAGRIDFLANKRTSDTHDSGNSEGGDEEPF